MVNKAEPPAPAIAAPLYAEIRRYILADLRDGVWRAGDRLPTEPKLAERFGVSISTIRRAIDELVNERVLLRQAGRGTFVASHSSRNIFEPFFQFSDARGKRIEASAELLSFKLTSPVAALKAMLLTSKPVARIVNLRRSGGQPLMLDRLFVPLQVFPDLTREAFVNRTGSIYGFYQEQYGVTVLRVEENLVAGAADRQVAKQLGVPDRSPVLKIERLAFSFDDRPVEWRERYVNTALCAYRNVVGLQLEPSDSRD